MSKQLLAKNKKKRQNLTSSPKKGKYIISKSILYYRNVFFNIINIEDPPCFSFTRHSNHVTILRFLFDSQVDRAQFHCRVVEVPTLGEFRDSAGLRRLQICKHAVNQNANNLPILWFCKVSLWVFYSDVILGKLLNLQGRIGERYR